MNKKLLWACIVAFLGAGSSLAAFAQQKPETSVKYRQAAMNLQGKYFYPMNRMAEGRAPYDANVVALNSSYLEVLSKMPWTDFDPSSKGAKSPVLPAVFAEPAKFKQAQERFQGEVAKLVTLSKSGDEASVKAQIGAVNKACGSCHDDFREPF